MGYVFDSNSNRLTVTTSSLENATEYKAERLSGSLTQLHDGTSYLVEGSNITITTGSNGSITIASAGGGGVSLGNDGNNRIVTALGDGNITGETNLTFDGNTNAFTVAGTSRAGAGTVGRLAYIHGSLIYKNEAEGHSRFLPLGSPGDVADASQGKTGLMKHVFATPHNGQVKHLRLAFSGSGVLGVNDIPGQVDARVYISTGSIANVNRIQFTTTLVAAPPQFKATGIANKTFSGVGTNPGVVQKLDFSNDVNRTFDADRLVLVAIDPANAPGSNGGGPQFDITYTLTLEYNEQTG